MEQSQELSREEVVSIPASTTPHHHHHQQLCMWAIPMMFLKFQKRLKNISRVVARDKSAYTYGQADGRTQR